MKAPLRHENISTTSQVYGQMEIEAKRRIPYRLIYYVVIEPEAQGWRGERPALTAGQNG